MEYIFREYHPPTERAFVLKKFRDSAIEAFGAEVLVKRTPYGTWIPFVYPIGPLSPDQMAFFWYEFMWWGHDPRYWGLEFKTKSAVIDWISRHLKSFGFKQW